MIALLEKLQKDAWRTSSNRYNAARRLRRREFFATVSFALMSSLTAAIAFIQRVYTTPDSSTDKYLSTVSASLGIFLLTLSLVEWGAKTGSVAESLHLNAEKLNTFWRKIAFQIGSATPNNPISSIDAQNLGLEYDALKADCRYNHEPIDDSYFRIYHTNVFGAVGLLRSIFIWLRWQLSSIWYIALLWIIISLLTIPLWNEK
jgi:hypothetical protein